jgi:hypothetical protein
MREERKAPKEAYMAWPYIYKFELFGGFAKHLQKQSLWGAL